MSLKNHSLTQEPKPVIVSPVTLLLPEIEKLSEAELVELRHEIDLRLQLDLDQMDLSEELALQYRQAKALQQEVQGDKQTPANQKAQIFNSVRAQLAEIVKQQESVYSMERLKVYEVAFVKATRLLTAEARDAFFDLYGRFLKDPNAADPEV